MAKRKNSLRRLTVDIAIVLAGAGAVLAGLWLASFLIAIGRFVPTSYLN